MGGMNHQPCGKYLLNSTLLSKAMCIAFSNLELANISLEDLIILELEDGCGSINQITEHLDESGKDLLNMLKVLQALRTQMDENSFQDLPTLGKIDLTAFGKQLEAEGLNQSVDEWDVAETCMRKYGFYGMIDVFNDRIQELISLTTVLHLKVGKCSKHASQGVVNLILEENQELNFKPEFARLYTSWAAFKQLFLASSLISTELWYQFNKFGSLTSKPEQLHAVA